MAKQAAKTKKQAKPKKAAARPKKAVAKPRARPAPKRAVPPTADTGDMLSTTEMIAATVAALNSAISKNELDELSPALMQRLLAAAIRAYSAKVQAGENFLPFEFGSARVSPTDVMITASGLLKAGDLQVFELGMWQSYTGR